MDHTQLVGMTALMVGVTLTLVQNSRLSVTVNHIERRMRDSHHILMELDAYYNMEENAEVADLHDVEQEQIEELMQNVELDRRIQRIKEEFARKTPPKAPLEPAIPLHPDVYNLDAKKIPDTSYMVEYVE